jgi:hypothetical protein
MLSDVLEVDAPVDLGQITILAKVRHHAVKQAASTRYSIAEATPREALKNSMRSFVTSWVFALFLTKTMIMPWEQSGNAYVR